MTDPTCTATRHGTTYHAYRQHRCRCPAAIADMRTEWRRQKDPNRQRRWTNGADVDNIAVARATHGDRSIRLTAAERAAAVHRLTNQRRSQRWIADQLGISTRTVVRHRTRTAA